MTDLILFNANVITMDPANPVAEMIAAERGMISFVGSNERKDVLKHRQTKIIDCAGKTLVPGFIDAHCHVQAYAEWLVSLNLSPQEGAVRSIADIQDKVGEFCRRIPAGSWVRGKGYNEFLLQEKRHPNRWDLDSAAPNNPVKLTHRSGHAHVLNSLALKLVGIDEETGDPPEGYIERAIGTGTPTGILYGMGRHLAGRIPPLDEAELNRGASLASRRLLSLGITSVQDATSMNSIRQWKQFERWKDNKVFQPRVTMMTGVDFTEHPFVSHIDLFNLRLGAVKIMAGEATGSLHPGKQELCQILARVHRAGRQAAIHAVEEPAILAAGEAIQFALEESNSVAAHRHRIEHCSVCPPELLRRLSEIGVFVVTQPGFIFSNGDRYLQTVPSDMLKHLYDMHSMLESGLRVAAGSDFPIAEANPITGIYSAVTRRTEKGSVLPQNGIGVLDALRLYTAGAAEASFEEGFKGSLTVGKIADIAMLSDDPLGMETEQLPQIRVKMTILGGKVAGNF